MATTELCWWPLPAWISPGAVMFVFFNVLVGAIVVTSRFQPGGGSPAASRRRLCRSASSMVLDRIRSFSMFSVHHAAECYDYHTCLDLEADEQQVMSEPASLQKPVPEPAAAEPRSAPAETLAEDLAASTSETRKEEADSSEENSNRSGEASVQGQQQQHEKPESSPPPLASTAAADDEATAAVRKPRKKKNQRKAARQRSKRRACASGREAEEEAPEARAELNLRAELFIQQFREDLKLQRLNSIINYNRALGGDAAPEHD
jgi:hypothetical protein